MSSVVRIRIENKKAIIQETYLNNVTAEAARDYIDDHWDNDSAKGIFFGIGEYIPLDYSQDHIYFNQDGDLILILPTIEYLPPESELMLIINPDIRGNGLEDIPLYYNSGERVRGTDESIK